MSINLDRFDPLTQEEAENIIENANANIEAVEYYLDKGIGVDEIVRDFLPAESLPWHGETAAEKIIRYVVRETRRCVLAELLLADKIKGNPITRAWDNANKQTREDFIAWCGLATDSNPILTAYLKSSGAVQDDFVDTFDKIAERALAAQDPGRAP